MKSWKEIRKTATAFSKCRNVLRIKQLVVSTLLTFAAGCMFFGPFRGVGVFEMSGRKVFVEDVVYGYAPEDDMCSVVQYRLTVDQLTNRVDIHSGFFATNFATSCKLLDILETNLISFAQQEKSIVVVKGAFYDPKKTMERDELGRGLPQTFFAAVYDETPPEKAIAFLIPAGMTQYESLASYSFPLCNMDHSCVSVFGKIKNREEIRMSFDPSLWNWHSRGDSKVNRFDVNDPVSGKPILSLVGTGCKALSAEETKKIDHEKYAVLKINVDKHASSYSKDGRIKYSSGFKGGIERWHYELAPDEGDFWLYLDEDYIRVHKPDCKKFEKGRGRHCIMPSDGGQFGDCCGGVNGTVQCIEEQNRKFSPRQRHRNHKPKQ